MGAGDTELKIGGLLGGVTVAETVALGFVCPVCVAGTAFFLAVGSLRKLKAKSGGKAGEGKSLKGST